MIVNDAKNRVRQAQRNSAFPANVGEVLDEKAAPFVSDDSFLVAPASTFSSVDGPKMLNAPANVLDLLPIESASAPTTRTLSNEGVPALEELLGRKLAAGSIARGYATSEKGGGAAFKYELFIQEPNNARPFVIIWDAVQQKRDCFGFEGELKDGAPDRGADAYPYKLGQVLAMTADGASPEALAELFAQAAVIGHRQVDPENPSYLELQVALEKEPDVVSRLGTSKMISEVSLKYLGYAIVDVSILDLGKVAIDQ